MDNKGNVDILMALNDADQKLMDNVLESKNKATLNETTEKLRQARFGW